ncbi:hypothetical protein Plec18167_006864 [Paecilomyces lecythidis]|uniref:Aspergillopepsin n=1 Tax=Paecilomyces lecythidis TaxID=3004212 RepID=A0ABR3X927_9EURO
MALLCFFATAQAAPTQRLLKRSGSDNPSLLHRSSPIMPAFAGPRTKYLSTTSAEKNRTYYSHNWAGAVLPKSALSFAPTLASVAATITVPIPTSSATNVQGASAWVGIDGFVNTAAILQTGIDIVAFEGEDGSYKPWYQWYPDTAIYFDLEIEAGDVLVMTVYSTTKSTGVAIIQNNSTGESATATVSAPHPGATLTGQSVEWIVEDYESGGSRVSFLDFGTVNFTGTEARGRGNQTFGVGGNGVVIVDMLMDNSSIVAEASVVGPSGVMVKYI